jgi:hypothetical protein
VRFVNASWALARRRMGRSAGLITFTFKERTRFGGVHINHTNGRQEVVRAHPTIKEDINHATDNKHEYGRSDGQ